MYDCEKKEGIHRAFEISGIPLLLGETTTAIRLNKSTGNPPNYEGNVLDPLL